jgi:drug/metabolite transporter (DMT)-like permease
VATLEATVPAPSERERALALGAALVTVSLWASAFVGVRAASRQLSPEALALGRLTIASIALVLVVLVRREPLPSRRDLPAIAFANAVVIGSATSEHGFAPSWGTLLCVAAAVFYAVGVVRRSPCWRASPRCRSPGSRACRVHSCASRSPAR